MSLLHYISFVAVLAAFAFVTLSLASGLLYVSELIEEHSRDAKLIGQRGIYAIIALHILLYVSESFPLHKIIFSVFCHVVYLQNFSANWPFINLSSPSFIASCVLVVADHFWWFSHFASVTQQARHSNHSNVPKAPNFAEIATFFGLCIWLAPLFLFLSLSAGDNALPTTASGLPSSPNSSHTVAISAQQHAPSSLFKSLFSVLPALGPRQRDRTEGLIAPRTPAIPPVNTIPSTPRSTSNPGPPPMTPRTPRTSGSSGEFELEARVVHSNPADFRLSLPPQRRGTLGAGAVGIGSPTQGLRHMRRVTAEVGMRSVSQRSE